MGMTIEESRKLLFQYKKLFNSLNGNYKLSQVQISELSHSISTALDTMRKYQKIEQILHNGFGKGVYSVFDEIVKVVEDGESK